MELQEIDVYIDKDGNVRIEVRGVAGKSCLELTAELEKALGGQVISREMTHEANLPEPVPVSAEERLKQHT